MSGLLAALALTTLVAVRNPFAPIGSEAGREETSARKSAPAPAPSAAEDLSRPADDVAWTVAMKRIRVGGRIRARRADGTEHASVILDGKPYGEGDLKSVVSGGRKFTWRVTGVEGERSKLRLERVGERKFEGKGGVR